jgi:hypothetical protein
MGKRRRRNQNKRSNKSLKTYATITDLPNEILLMILHDLQPDDLCHLAVLCRRLHTMALPIYFSKLSYITTGWQVIFESCDIRALRGLRLALFINKIDVLRCTLSDLTLEGMKGLRGLVLKMSIVSKVQLNANVGLSCQPTIPRLEAAAVNYFLLALAEKSCHNLSIVGGGNRLVLNDRNVEVVFLRTLREVTIKGAPFLFLSRFRSWTIGSLNFSQIHSLTLSDVPKAFPKILPALKLKHLETFTISSQNISFTLLANFLSRHRKIHTLTIDEEVCLDRDPLPPRVLSALTTFRGHAHTLLHLCSEPSNSPLRVVHLLDDLLGEPSSFRHQLFSYLAPTKVHHLSFRFIKIVPPQTHRLLRSSFKVAECSMNHLKSIEVHSSALDHDSIRGISDWLRLFPALGSVIFTSWAMFTQTPEQKESFIKDISVACPKLQTVKLTGGLWSTVY